jgi:hypothetical protein
VKVRFLADEDLRTGIIQGLRSREPAIDILDVKTAGLRGMKDPTLLELADQQGRIIISHDRETMTRYFRERLDSGKFANTSEGRASMLKSPQNRLDAVSIKISFWNLMIFLGLLERKCCSGESNSGKIDTS